MTTISDKFNRAFASKEAIRQALISKGVDVPDNTPFADYAKKINDITVGDDNNPYQKLYMQRTANETSMKGLFAYTPASSNLDLSMMNTSQVTDMSNMFDNCKVPYLDLSGFNVGNVTNMSNMFNQCNSEININGWVTSKLTDANYMFSYFTNRGKYLDLSVLDFSNITKSDSMFGNCNVDYIDIRNINLNLSKLNKMPFNNVSGKILDLSNYDITGLKSTYQLCYFCSCPTVDLTNWKTTEVTDMRNTFYYNSSLEKIIMPDWDMTNATNTSNFFYSCGKLNYIDLSRSNDATIAKIATLVPAKKLATYGQILIPADSSQANIDALVAKYWRPIGPRIDMTSCEIATELDEIKPGKSTKLCYGNQEPWYGNDSSVEYISSDESVAIIDKETMMITSTGVEGTTEITARIADTQEVISEPITLSVSETDNYPNVIKIKRNSANSGNITINGATKNINNCFIKNNISGVWTYDVGAPITSFNFGNSGDYVSELVKININNMTTMEKMFSGCKNLITLDLSDWDTSNVTGMNGMSSMFAGCSNLAELNISNFDTTNVTSVWNMFGECNKLQELRLDNCNYDTINKIIKQTYLPTGTIDGVTRKIYCKEENAAGLIAPDGWEFIYIDSSADSEEPIPGGPNVDGGEPGGGMPGMPGTDGPEIAPEGPTIPEEPSEPTQTYVISFSTLGSKKLTVNNVDVTDQVVETGGYGDTISCKYETTEVIRQASFKDNTDLVRVFGLDTSMMFHTEEMFSGCTNLVAILSVLDSDMAYSTRAMFKNCTSLTGSSLDYIGAFSAATDKSEMFYNCTSLTGTVEAYKYWDNAMTSDHSNCFYNCTSLDNYSDIPASWKGSNN